MSLLEELDEALDAGHGDTVLVTREFLGRLHGVLVMVEQRRGLLALANGLGIPPEVPQGATSYVEADYKLAKTAWERSYFTDLRKRFPNYKAMSAGCGIERNYLKKKLAQHGLYVYPGRENGSGSVGEDGEAGESHRADGEDTSPSGT